MYLKNIEVKNFRLLKNFSLELKDNLSLVIGKNNCGKTSLITVMEKMINLSKISWDDINLQHQKEIYEQFKSDDIDAIDSIEAVTLILYIEYNEEDSYAEIQKFMMDLDPDNNIIALEFISLITKDNLQRLKIHIDEKKKNDFHIFSKFMKKNFSKYFEIKRYSRRYDAKTGKLTGERSDDKDSKDIQKLIKISGIRADRPVSNDESNHVLSILTEKYFNAFKATDNESENVFNDLEQEIEEADEKLKEIYNDNNHGIFIKVIDALKTYGGIENGIQISIDSSISEKNLLSNNTHLSYKLDDQNSLPETYNGLGYLNLIGIVFAIETRIQEIFEKPAEINFLYIEEPEAHTHPQLQYIFIRNIKDHLSKHEDNLLSQKNKRLQFLMTSHSSHIVSECDFDDLIYLKKQDGEVVAKSFNLLKDIYENDKEAFKFIKQYLTLNRSELFFADKAICIEGDTERILMPMMMHKLDKEIENSITKEAKERDLSLPLLSQNISIIEVGAYSHLFIPLFEFLGTKVLIITDIDAAKKEKNFEGKVSYKKCRPEEAEYTTNASIKNFFKDDGIDSWTNQFKELTIKKENEKVKGNLRIAYQIPEIGGTYQARSFEDAFIELNKNFIKMHKDELIAFEALKNFEDIELNDAYSFAKNVKKKSTFAASLIYYDTDDADGNGWKIPRYIKEGLVWLKRN